MENLFQQMLIHGQQSENISFLNTIQIERSLRLKWNWKPEEVVIKKAVLLWKKYKKITSIVTVEKISEIFYKCHLDWSETNKTHEVLRKKNSMEETKKIQLSPLM